MLKFFRKHIKIVIWAIVLAFALWGAGSITVSQKEGTSYAGIINGEKISFKEYLLTARFYELLFRAQAQTETQSPAGSSEVKAEEIADARSEETPDQTVSFDQIRSAAWQSLALSREALRNKLLVSDEEVRSQIREFLFGEALFDAKFYESWLDQRFRGSARDFEETVRKHLLAGKLRAQFLADVPEEDHHAKWLSKLTAMMNEVRVEDFAPKAKATA